MAVVESSIVEKLKDALSPLYLEVVNESHMHAVPVNSETHFKVVIASAAFDGLRAVARHQRIYQLLAEEMAAGVHALALHTYSVAEWSEKQPVAPDSPQCLGGSREEK